MVTLGIYTASQNQLIGNVKHSFPVATLILDILVSLTTDGIHAL